MERERRTDGIDFSFFGEEGGTLLRDSPSPYLIYVRRVGLGGLRQWSCAFHSSHPLFYFFFPSYFVCFCVALCSRPYNTAKGVGLRSSVQFTHHHHHPPGRRNYFVFFFLALVRKEKEKDIFLVFCFFGVGWRAVSPFDAHAP